MSFSKSDFTFQNKVVLGRALFKGPFKVNAVLEEEARFVHVRNGSSTLFVPNNKHKIESGDSFLIKCESFVNSWEANEDGSFTEVVIFQFYPETLKEVYKDGLPDFFNTNKSIPHEPIEKVSSHELITTFYNSLNYYFDHPEMMTDDLMILKIKELIHILAKTDRSGKVKLILANLFISSEHEFKDVINAHLYQHLKLDDLAFFTGLSLSTFKRKFKSIFGKSPKHYINSKKLERAKFLLETSELRISEIAYECGYNDVAYFSRTFQSEFDISPSNYKSQLTPQK